VLLDRERKRALFVLGIDETDERGRRHSLDRLMSRQTQVPEAVRSSRLSCGKVGKAQNIHLSSGAIWGIPVNEISADKRIAS
jgi:hypothetical protein